LVFLGKITGSHGFSPSNLGLSGFNLNDGL
jgi:hypothetical protein